MKTLLIVIPTLRMGGAEKALISLLKSLDQNVVNVDLFLFESGGILQKEVPEWVNVIEADEVTRAMTLEARYYLREILKKGHLFAAVSRLWTAVLNKFGYKIFSWDIVKKYIPEIQKHYDVAIGFLEGTTDFFVIDKVQADRKIGWIHTDLTRHIVQNKDIEYYNRFDKIVTISEKCRKTAISSIPGIEDKICVIENVVLPEEIIRKSEESIEIDSDNCFRIVTVGRIEYDKGIDLGAQAAKLLKKHGVDFKWYVLGYGSQEENVREYVKENMLLDNYILHGMVSNPYPYIKMADLIVQPSRNEGKSIVLDEAKILGKAIVATNYASVKDQIKDHETGIIVDITPNSIASGIELLMRDKDLKKQIENNCMNEDYAVEEVMKQFYRIIGV
ncbi:MAG: glycosyltransferase [Erysipelotrichaceae bacterium]|nr:glycosyltransferase [Erysipelotrichaceae bacterium]